MSKWQTRASNLEGLLASERAERSPWQFYSSGEMVAVLQGVGPDRSLLLEAKRDLQPVYGYGPSPIGLVSSPTSSVVSVPILDWSDAQAFEETLSWAILTAGMAESIGSWEHLPGVMLESFRHSGTGKPPTRLLGHPGTLSDITLAALSQGPAFGALTRGLGSRSGHPTYFGVELVPAVHMERDSIVLCAEGDLGTVFVRGERRAGLMLHANRLRTYRLHKSPPKPRSFWDALLEDSVLDGP